MNAPLGVVISSDTAAAPPLGIDSDSDVLDCDPLDLEVASEPTRPDSVLLPTGPSPLLIGPNDDEIADGFVIGALRVAKADAAATGQRHSMVVAAVAIVRDLIVTAGFVPNQWCRVDVALRTRVGCLPA